LFGLNIDYAELAQISDNSFWCNSLTHLEIGYCGLWTNLEFFEHTLKKASKLQHLKFIKSNGIGFGDSQVSELWDLMKGPSQRNNSAIEPINQVTSFESESIKPF
jgi:hypothetical protein